MLLWYTVAFAEEVVLNPFFPNTHSDVPLSRGYAYPTWLQCRCRFCIMSLVSFMRLHGNFSVTRMHSSRMRTARSLPYGGLCPRGSCPGGSLSRGVRCSGVSCLGGSRVSVQGGLTDRDRPPVNRMTDRCKNITLPQLRCGR